MDITIETDTLKYKATVIALRQYFCDVDSDSEYEENLVRLFDNGFEDDSALGKYTVRQPFENYGIDEVYEFVSSLRDSIVDEITPQEPNHNNYGYTGIISVGHPQFWDNDSI